MTAPDSRTGPPPEPPEAVCFDLDDTLYPYAEYARAGLGEAADRLAARNGVDVSDELVELYFEEGVRSGTFDRLVERYDLESGLVDELVAAYHDASDPLDAHPDAESTLKRLRESFRLGVITDGRNGRSKLGRLGLAEYFDAVVVNTRFGLTKRDREPFDRAVAALGVPPTRTVYVGDDPRVDFAVPNRLGMRTVRIRQGRNTDLEPAEQSAAPDGEIDALEELPALLGVDSLTGSDGE